MADSTVAVTSAFGALRQCVRSVAQIALAVAALVLLVGGALDRWHALDAVFETLARLLSFGVWLNTIAAATTAAMALVLICSVFNAVDEFEHRRNRHDGLRFRAEALASAGALRRRLMPRVPAALLLVFLAMQLMASAPAFFDSNWTLWMARFVTVAAIFVALLGALLAGMALCSFDANLDGQQ